MKLNTTTARLLLASVLALAITPLMANPLNVASIRSENEAVDDLTLVIGRISHDYEQRTAESTIAINFTDRSTLGLTTVVTVLVTGTYNTVHANGKGLYQNPRISGEAIETITFDNGKILRRTIKTYALAPGASVDGNIKSRQFGLYVVSQNVPGYRSAKTYMFTGTYESVSLADTNDDKEVDLSDLNNVRNNFGHAGNFQLGDTNYDGKVDLSDLNAVRNLFN
jgi:hypothetical protein